MAVLHLVRHGFVDYRVTDGSEDPGLTDLGRQQATALAVRLRGDHLATSPLRRCRETAEPLAAACGVSAEVVPAVGEVVPAEMDPDARRAFLEGFMGGTWKGQPDWLLEWRQGVIDALHDLAGR